MCASVAPTSPQALPLLVSFGPAVGPPRPGPYSQCRSPRRESAWGGTGGAGPDPGGGGVGGALLGRAARQGASGPWPRRPGEETWDRPGEMAGVWSLSAWKAVS